MARERIAVVGSRDWPESEYDRIDELIFGLPKDALIITGGASGVDAVVERCAKRLRRSRLIEEPVDAGGLTHEQYRDALLARNDKIALYSTRLVAFWSGSLRSSGTLHAVSRAQAHGRPVEWIISFSSPLSSPPSLGVYR